MNKKIKGGVAYNLSEDTVMITEGPWAGRTITLSVDVLEEE
jgi:hypothetical protein